MPRHRPSALRRSLRNFYARYSRVIIAVCILSLLETLLHVRSFAIPRPATVLDAPFHKGCATPDLSLPRANATILMLARNSDVDGAEASIRSVEEKFNKLWKYPIVFLNDQAWSSEFKERLMAVTSGDVVFETIDEGMWGYPEWIDQDRARRSMKSMEKQGIMYAGKESYHHMCRFNSGMFYDHPALQKYKWYWRVEPDISFTCSITYDPFVEMEKHGKKYGYTVALWEMGTTIPTLFRKMSDYKKGLGIKTSPLWTAMMDPSYLPWPIRPMLSLLRNRDANGDMYNQCHFWSNFEIADMDWFRSPEYRNLFQFLDEDGGFYYERWGDAPVHSLAAGLLLEPQQLHHFADFGYVHEPFQQCPYQYPDGTSFGADEINRDIPAYDKEAEAKYTIGCDCFCNRSIPVISPICLNTLKKTVF